jgi:hypothetical protein
MRHVTPLALALGMSACTLAPEVNLAGAAAAADGQDKMVQLFGPDQTPLTYVTDNFALVVKPSEGNVLAYLCVGARDDIALLGWSGDHLLAESAEHGDNHSVALHLAKDGHSVERLVWTNKNTPDVLQLDESLRGTKAPRIPEGPFGRLFGGYLEGKTIEVTPLAGQASVPNQNLNVRARGSWVVFDFVEQLSGREIYLFAPTRITSPEWTWQAKGAVPHAEANHTYGGKYDIAKHEVTLWAKDGKRQLLQLVLKLTGAEDQIWAVVWARGGEVQHHGVAKEFR